MVQNYTVDLLLQTERLAVPVNQLLTYQRRKIKDEAKNMHILYSLPRFKIKC